MGPRAVVVDREARRALATVSPRRFDHNDSTPTTRFDPTHEPDGPQPDPTQTRDAIRSQRRAAARVRASPPRKLEHAVVAVIGSGRVGKTCVIDSLMDKVFDLARQARECADCSQQGY